MRTKNAFKNFMASTGSQVINLLLAFVCRTVFIYTLSKQYLGVSGLFTNILTVLSLAELGIGTAMIYHMYEPVAREDKVALTQLMNFYKRLYMIVAGIIAVAGLALTPFLDYLIKDKPDIPELTFIYLLYLFNTVASYFFSYKRAIIDAHQKNYICAVTTTGLMMCQNIVQIVVLYVFRNFVAYLLVQIVFNVLTNIIIAFIANKMYPYIVEDRKALPSKETRKSIYKNMSAMFLHRLGDVVVNNTDSLIMSAFVGLIPTAIYSNYLLLLNSVNAVTVGMFGAFTASVGNLTVEEDKDTVFKIYNALNFFGFWVYSFCAVAFMVLFNPFIEVWAGEDYLFPLSIVLTLVLVFYVRGMRRVTLTFRDAMGLYWYDRYKPIFEVVVNLVVSLVLVQKIGIVGIFIGTLVSNLGICCWIEPYVTYKYGFEKKVSHFFLNYAIYALVLFGAGGFTYYVCSFINMGGVLEIVLKALVMLALYNVIVLLIFFKTQNFKVLYEKGKSFLLRRKGGKK